MWPYASHVTQLKAVIIELPNLFSISQHMQSVPSPLQFLQSLALIQGLLADDKRLSDQGKVFSPELHKLLLCVATTLSQPGEVREKQSNVSTKRVLECLNKELHSVESSISVVSCRLKSATDKLTHCYHTLAKQQQATASTLDDFIGLVGSLQNNEALKAQYLTLNLPDGFEEGRLQLKQQGLACLRQANSLSGRCSSEHDEDIRIAMQSCSAAVAERVQTQVNFARLHAEVSGQPDAGQENSDHSQIDSNLGNLNCEIQMLERKLKDRLFQVQQRAKTAALQEPSRRILQAERTRAEYLKKRCAVKEKIVELMIRQGARQLLVRLLAGKESKLLCNMHAVLQAALNDGHALLYAIQQRIQEKHMQQQQQLAREAQDAVECSDSGIFEALVGTCPGVDLADVPMAVTEELLKTRADLQACSNMLQHQLLPAQQTAFAQLHSTIFQGGRTTCPVLAESATTEKLAKASEAAGSLQQAATTVLMEVIQRQQQRERHAIKEQVLVDFWNNPHNLTLRAQQLRNAAHE